MGGGPIDPTQILAGNFGTPGPAPQQAPMTPQAPAPQPQGMPGSDLDSQIKQQILQQGQMGMGGYQQTMGQMGDLSQRAQALQQQLGSLPLPKTSVTDEPWMKMQPVHGQGVGGDLKNLLSDIGRGMLAGVGATGPGRAIQQGLYGPGERAYGMQSRNLAQQISDIQGQQKTLGESLGPTTNLATRQGVNYGAVERGGAAVMKEETRRVTDQAKIQLEAKAQELQKQIAAGKLSAEQARTQMMKVTAEILANSRTTVGAMFSDQRDRDAQISAFENEYKVQSEDWMQRLLGSAPPAPSQQSTPAAGPKAAGSKVPAKSASSGVQEGATATGPNNHKIKFTGGRWVDAATGKPIQ